MEYIAAGLIALLSVIVGTVSSVVAACSQLPTDREPEIKDRQDNEITKQPAAVYFHAVKQLRAKQWLLIAIPSLLIGAASIRLVAGTSGLVNTLRMEIVALALFSAFLIDMKTRRIPNVLVLLMLGLGAVCYFIQFLLDRAAFKEMILSAVIGLVGCLVLFYVLARITRDGIGMGDVKLLAAQGWLLGFTMTLTSTLFGLIACSVMAAVMLISKKMRSSDHVPFGPFIFTGYLLVLFIC